jgi:subtilisin family serine protease
MHILSAAKQVIELDPLPSEFKLDAGRLALDFPTETAVSPVSRAMSAFFEMGLTAGPTRAADLPKGPPPAVFRERQSGLLRMVYREAIIRFKPKVSAKRRQQVLDKYGFKLRTDNKFIPDQVVVFTPDQGRVGAEMLAATNDWASMDEVIFATPNFVSQFQRLAKPVAHPQQWHLENKAAYPGQLAGEDVDALQAWLVSAGKTTIIVAVLDDGVDVDHPNLKAAIKKKPDLKEPRDLCGRDFFVPEDHPEHFNPRPKLFRYPYDHMAGNDIHGTPCAGVIGARGYRAGAVGVAPKCKILPVKIFHGDDLASDARVADAIRYAALHADILSCSWGGPRSPDLELAITDAGTLGRQGKGAAIFVATGNASSSVSFPASHPEAIGVGASTDQAKLAYYSNTGQEVWVVAPSNGGVRGIFTTDVSIPNRGFNLGTEEAGGVDGLHTNSFGGTSSATPLAAGIGALILSVKPSLDRTALKEILKNVTDKIGGGYDPQGHSLQFGYGRLNAAKAVKLGKTP